MVYPGPGVAPSGPGVSCFETDLAIDGGGILYVTTGCGYVSISRDEGHTWEHQTFPDMPDGPYSVRVASQRAGRAALRGFNRILTTDDGGRTWSTLVTGDSLGMAMAPDGTIWTAEDGQLYRYDSSGRTSIPVQRRAATAHSFEVAGVDGRVLFVTTENDGQMRSADGGATWSAVSGTANDIYFVSSVPGQPSVVYGITFGGPYFPLHLWFSRDAGANWDEVPVPAVPTDFSQYGPLLPVGPQPGVVYSTWQRMTGGFTGQNRMISKVIRSTDGGRSWTPIDDGLGSPSSRQLTIVPGDVSSLYARTEAGVFRTYDAGATWRQVWSSSDRGLAFSLTADAVDSLVAYLLGPGGGVWLTEDGGDHWQAATMPTPSDFISQIIADTVDSRRAFAIYSSGDVFETRDAAQSWTHLSVGAGGWIGASRIVARGDARWMIASDFSQSTIVSLDLSKSHPIALGTDLWWNPAQPGWGLSLAQHDNYQIFAVWFTYDALGKPTWRFIPGGTWVDSNTFTGALYVSSVPPRDFFASAFTSPTITPVGSVNLHFTDANSGEATFVLADRVVRQPIARMAFGPIDKTQGATADLWFNPSQSGWGFAIHQQYSTLFATWFLYNDDGSPTWLLMPDATSQDGNTSGDVYRATGSAGAPFEAKGVAVSKVGTASFIVWTDSPVLRATIDGRSWSSPISRIPF